MKHKLFFAIAIFTAAIAMLGLSACNESDNGYSAPRYLDIVTVKSSGPEGLVLTVYKPNTSIAATLTSDRAVSGEHMPVGSRIVISYSAEQGQYVSGPVTLYIAVPTIGLGGEIPAANLTDISAVRSEAIMVPEFYVTANYIDFSFQAYTASTTTVTLTLDEATLDDAYPKAYLKVVNPMYATTMNQLYFGSYSLENFLSKPTFKGLEIFYTLTGSTQQSTKVDARVSSALEPSQKD